MTEAPALCAPEAADALLHYASGEEVQRWHSQS
mgnify:CR=1 FL=1